MARHLRSAARHGTWFKLAIAVGACTLAAGCSSGSAENIPKEGGTQTSQVPQTTTVLLLSAEEVALLNSSTHAIVKTFRYNGPGTLGGAGTQGDWLVAFARTSRGLTAYVLEYGEVLPVYLANDTIGQPIQISDGPTFEATFIAASPDGKTVYAASGSSPAQRGEVTPIDTATNRAGRPIPVGPLPEGLTFGPGGKTLYVTDAGDSTVTPVNVADGTAGQPISFGQGESNWNATVITPDGKTVYVLNGSQLIPIDTTAGVAGTPIALHASPVPVTGATAGNAGPAAQLGASPLVLSPNGTTLYDGLLEGKGWTAIDTATNTVSAYLAPNSESSELLLAPDGRTLYGIDATTGNLTAVDTKTDTVIMHTSDGGGQDAAITPDGRTIFILNGETVVPFNTVTRTMGKPIQLPQTPNGFVHIAVAP